MKICESIIWILCDCDSMICMQGFSLSKSDQHFVIMYSVFIDVSQSMIKLFWANIEDENYNFFPLTVGCIENADRIQNYTRIKF